MNTVVAIFYIIAVVYLVGLGIFAIKKKVDARKSTKRVKKENDERERQEQQENRED